MVATNASPMTEAERPEFLVKVDAARLLGMSPGTLYAALEADETLRACLVVVPGFKLPKFSRDLLLAWRSARVAAADPVAAALAQAERQVGS